MRYYIIAGEASGDLHGANLINALHSLDSSAEIYAWGGDLMQAQGVVLRKHYRDLAFMGFIEVLKNIKTIFKNIAFCKKDILEFQPDAIIFIDYPGFNLRIAKWARKAIDTYILKTKTGTTPPQLHYYISPQIWAWHTSRVHEIKKNIDHLYCILPFEKDFYHQFNYDIDYVGHPLVDVVNQAKQSNNTSNFKEKNNLDNRPIIALLPGSRRQEIEIILPLMLTISPQFIDYQFIIAAANSHPLSYYTAILSKINDSDFNLKNIKIVQNQTYELLQNAEAALVKSGTSTLETALFDVPQVVCYKGSPISYAIAKRVVKVKYISLVNLIMDKEIVKELIQNELNKENLTYELNNILKNKDKIKKEYAQLRGILGAGGASELVAKMIFERLKNKDV